MMKNKVQGREGKPRQKLTDEELLQTTGGGNRPPLYGEECGEKVSKSECKKYKDCKWQHIGEDKNNYECVKIGWDFW